MIDTFVRFNGACNFVSMIAFEKKLYNRVFLQKVVYKDIRKTFDHAAQLTIRVTGKVVEMYGTDRNHFHEFRDYSSIVYDQRVLNFKGMDKVSINTTSGRIRIPMTIVKYGQIPLERIRGQCDLIRKNKLFCLMVSVEVHEEPVIEPENITGIDMGITNIAVDSTGRYYSSNKIREIREHNAYLRSRLQSVGTKSSKRHMKKLSGKESRFVRNTSHVISSEIVHEAKGNSSTTAMENLEGIRMGTTVMKGKMYIHNSWSFQQFRSFIEYRAREAGIPVIVIDPHNTSRECPNCHA